MPTTSSGLIIPEPLSVLGYTGSRATPRDLAKIHEHLALTGAEAVGHVTGACIGMDAVIGDYCFKRWPYRRHVVFVPNDDHLIHRWWLEFPGRVDVIQMPPGTTYKDRNQAIVNASDRLIGYPIAGEKDPSQRRSGTWQTIRMGRRDHVEEPIILRLDSL